MKNKKIFRMLAIGVILSLLVIVIPASPALAAYGLELEQDEGEIGEYIDFYSEGESWNPSDPSGDPPTYEYVDIYFTSDEASAGEDIDDEVNTYQLVEDKIQIDSSGEFEGRFRVPSEMVDGSPDEDVRGGTYYICVTYWDEEDIKAVVEFTITAGEITDFDPDSGPVGTEVDISGENFADDEDLTVEYDGDDIDFDGDSDTGSSGNFDIQIIIPPSTAGDHTITIADESLSEIEEIFEVEPEMTYSPTQAPPGDTVEVSGTGFGDRVDVDIYLGTDSVATETTDRDGSFTASFIVPEVDEGTYSLVAEDEDGNDYEVSFIVEIGIETTIRPVTSAAAPGYVGQSVTVSGTGFQANSTITITYATTPVTVATTTSDSEGAFTATFKIPKSEAGAHTITASDGSNSLEVPFYMESEAPDTPVLLSPEADVKAPAMTVFEWEGVEDDSGVTYDLQVATSENFAAASIEVDILGITDVEYTLTKEQALASRSAEEPYYWRVRAVDGVGNEGDWTEPGDFSVGFGWPDWIIHLWWGLGVIGAIFLGYYLGKRRAYYY